MCFSVLNMLKGTSPQDIIDIYMEKQRKKEKEKKELIKKYKPDLVIDKRKIQNTHNDLW